MRDLLLTKPIKMKTKLRILILTMPLFFLTTSLKSQTKYEFATLRSFPEVGGKIKHLEGITLSTKEGIEVINARPEVIEVETEITLNELSAQGWEVYDVTCVVSIFPYYSYSLRRKLE